VPIAGIHLLHQELYIGKMEDRSCTNREPARHRRRGMAIKNPRQRTGRPFYRKQQIELKKTPGAFRDIMIESRFLPLVGNGKIQQSIPIYICRGDATRDLRFGKAELRRKINESAGACLNKKTIVIAAA